MRRRIFFKPIIMLLVLLVQAGKHAPLKQNKGARPNNPNSPANTNTQQPTELSS
ncbi:hypothetical protein [Glutamicibacter mishrai]|uniref:hypothetical protein n=1 Tax=Glutamicibacter mishrai TaxID=1775880 RepID=UPI003F78B17A